MNAALDAMARRLYGWTKAEAQAVLSCVRCRNTVDLRGVPEVDRREYELSGICPTCWRELFPPEDES